ncbi:MAG TPA: Fe-S cluster assembly protein SufB [Candidatus Nanoarchaeia archaeon]|nr:Fe-S cluster assembly protein SufB [Candidatus Nanoarchaeia archaeon]
MHHERQGTTKTMNDNLDTMFGQRTNTAYIHVSEEGKIDEEVVRNISKSKNEPEWMLQKRLHALQIYRQLQLPTWGPSLKELDMNTIAYYSLPEATPNARRWEDVPEEIKNTFERLGIPEAEKKALAGVGSQFDSQAVYHKLREDLEKLGVIFEDMDEAVHNHPELVKKYFMTSCVPPTLHKFVALHGACWSGGSFIYVPKGVKVDLPLQAYFRMNIEKGGQFEHTLIVVDEGAELQYVEGCSSPRYTTSALHAGCVELFVHKKARLRYSSVENWSKNTYNLNTKRAIVDEEGIMEWVGGNAGSKVSMLYPCTILKGANSKAEHLGIAYAGKGQEQDVGAKVYHIGKNTTSIIKSKSISKDGGINTYRGIVKINPGATGAKSHVQCDAIILDEQSISNTIPIMDIQESKTTIGHEATVGKIDPEKIFYLQSRGLTEEEALKLVVTGFVAPIMKELPLEYAVELNRLIELEMENSIG